MVIEKKIKRIQTQALCKCSVTTYAINKSFSSMTQHMAMFLGIKFQPVDILNIFNQQAAVSSW